MDHDAAHDRYPANLHRALLLRPWSLLAGGAFDVLESGVAYTGPLTIDVGDGCCTRYVVYGYLAP
jgi:hypothetical protein